MTHASRYPAPVLSMGISPNCTTLAVGMTSGLLSIRTREGSRRGAAAPVGRGGRGMLGLRPKARKRQRQQLQVRSDGTLRLWHLARVIPALGLWPLLHVWL